VEGRDVEAFGVAVPKVAADEDDGLLAPEDNIGFASRKASAFQVCQYSA